MTLKEYIDNKDPNGLIRYLEDNLGALNTVHMNVGCAFLGYLGAKLNKKAADHLTVITWVLAVVAIAQLGILIYNIF